MAAPGGNINNLRRPEVPRRRSARQALAMIPDSPTTNNSSPSTGVNTLITTIATTARRRYSTESWNAAPSPDEMVIQKRGRRKSIVWSPEVDSLKREGLFRDRTPGKTPKKNQTAIRIKDTPRKRLSLGEDGDIEMASPDKSDKPFQQFTGNLANGLRGLSHDQLVKMILDLVKMQEKSLLTVNESLSEIILQNMPVADVHPLCEKLSILRQNVYASLVSSNLDESDYNRAYIHLENFLKTLKEQGQNLIESQHWTAVVHYVLTAWAITKDLPEWKNQGMHSTARKCFRYLMEFCMLGLKNGAFTKDELCTYKERLQSFVEDYADIQVCLQLINETIV